MTVVDAAGLPLSVAVMVTVLEPMFEADAVNVALLSTAAFPVVEVAEKPVEL